MATETFAISMHMVPIMQAQKVQAYWPQPCKSTPILLGKWYPPQSVTKYVGSEGGGTNRFGSSHVPGTVLGS